MSHKPSLDVFARVGALGRVQVLLEVDSGQECVWCDGLLPVGPHGTCRLRPDLSRIAVPVSS